jgi:hypothetical protein
MHFEHHAHAITQELVQLLRELPKEGNQKKINTAEQIIKAYEAPTITRPSSPLSEENLDDELFPIPIHFPSAWCRTNKENIPPRKSTNPFTINPVKEEAIEGNIPNINSEDFTQEVIHLKAFLFTVPTAPVPIKFKLPSDYEFWIKQDEELGMSYWKVVLSAFMKKNKQSNSYQGTNVEYAQAGPDNNRHFIGFNEDTNQWIIADRKKKLFSAIVPN